MQVQFDDSLSFIDFIENNCQVYSKNREILQARVICLCDFDHYNKEDNDLPARTNAAIINYLFREGDIILVEDSSTANNDPEVNLSKHDQVRYVNFKNRLVIKGWDDFEAREQLNKKIKQNILQGKPLYPIYYLDRRNKRMIQLIQENLGPDNRVFVIGGTAHFIYLELKLDNSEIKAAEKKYLRPGVELTLDYLKKHDYIILGAKTDDSEKDLKTHQKIDQEMKEAKQKANKIKNYIRMFFLAFAVTAFAITSIALLLFL